MNNEATTSIPKSIFILTNNNHTEYVERVTGGTRYRITNKKENAKQWKTWDGAFKAANRIMRYSSAHSWACSLIVEEVFI